MDVSILAVVLATEVEIVRTAEVHRLKEEAEEEIDPVVPSAAPSFSVVPVDSELAWEEAAEAFQEVVEDERACSSVAMEEEVYSKGIL